MFKNKKPGISIVETMLVIAISSALFVVVIGVFNTQKSSQQDDAARQLMDEIAKIRNQAQQGQGPTDNASDPKPTAGYELFGQAIEFVKTGSASGSKIIVHKLQQNPVNKTISDYSSYEVSLPNQLQWNIFKTYSGTTCSGSGESTTPNYASCVKNVLPNFSNLDGRADGNIFLVTRVGNGQTYLLSGDTNPTYSYKNYINYKDSNQAYFQLAFGIPGSGSSDILKTNASTKQYLGLFDLKIPNNQQLKVLK
jgi:type II secretory pathway pseudopilin PulG